MLEDPRGMCERLCERLGVRFDTHMLSWPPGSRPADGVWAKHWYKAVEESTSFEPYHAREGELTRPLAALRAECQPFYDTLFEHRLTP